MKKDFTTLINETTDAKVLFTWGRFNPPTSGHEKLITKLSSEADSRGADFKIFPTKSEDPKKNPLSFKDKVKFMKKAFPTFKKNISSNTKVRTIIDALKDLSTQGYKEVTVVVGSDRVREFKRLVDKYNGGREFKFEKVDVISAGERNPDAEDVTGMSASKLRALALDGKKKEFMSGLPSSMPSKARSDMFKAVRKGMRIEQVNEIIDQKLLNEGIFSSAIGSGLILKGAKYFRDKKSKKLNKDFNVQLSREVKVKKPDFSSVSGPKFLRLLRLGLVKSPEISLTRLAFADMQKSASAPPMRERIFRVTQTMFDTILNDDLLYRRFLVLLHRKDMFGEQHLSGLVKKSNKNEVGFDLILEVYLRGLMDWDEEAQKRRDPNQYAFDRVNSFLSGGRASFLDEDLSCFSSDGSDVPFKEPKDRAGDWGTSKPANKYLKNTPGQPNSMDEIEEIEYGKTLNIDKEFSEFLTKE